MVLRVKSTLTLFLTNSLYTRWTTYPCFPYQVCATRGATAVVPRTTALSMGTLLVLGLLGET